MAHPEDLKQSAVLLKRHFAGELPNYDYECRMKHKDGHWVWVRDRGRVITRTGDGQPLMMFGTHSDITERNRAEEELQAKMVELQRWHAVTLGREGRIGELKREVNELSTRLGQLPPYADPGISEQKEPR